MLQDDGNSLVIHGVAFAVHAGFGQGAGKASEADGAAGVGLFGNAAFEDAFDIVGLATDFAPAGDDLVDFVVGDVGAVNALRQVGAGRQVEHVALAQQGLGAHLVKDGARVDLGGNLEGNP